MNIIMIIERQQQSLNKLKKIKADLEKQIKELEENVPDFGDDIDHFEEQADKAEKFSTNLGTAQAFRKRLDDVNHALDKMIQGKYGLCENCGREIELKILDIDPESRYCKACKH